MCEFLLAITNIDDISHEQANLLCTSMECLMKMVNSNAIGPYCFLTSVLTYFLSGSKQIVSLLSNLTAGGSYSTITKWLSDNSGSDLKCTLDGDYVSFFDNSQVLGRNWRVHFDCKALMSCITSLIHINSNSNLQTQSMLSPKYWINLWDNGEQINQTMVDYTQYLA